MFASYSEEAEVDAQMLRDNSSNPMIHPCLGTHCPTPCRYNGPPHTVTRTTLMQSNTHHAQRAANNSFKILFVSHREQNTFEIAAALMPPSIGYVTLSQE